MGENLGESVGDMFQSLGEKPKFDVSRVGIAKVGHSRPVKVIFRTVDIAKSVLGKASKLRDISIYRQVYMSPDRTKSQREEQRALVTELKRRRTEEPGKRHYIRGEKVETIDVQ